MPTPVPPIPYGWSDFALMRRQRFEDVFGGTDIGGEPTANRSRYVILRFDFSAFDDTLETLQERFEMYCEIKLRGALERNSDLFSDETRARCPHDE